MYVAFETIFTILLLAVPFAVLYYRSNRAFMTFIVFLFLFLLGLVPVIYSIIDSFAHQYNAFGPNLLFTWFYTIIVYISCTIFIIFESLYKHK